MIASIEIFDHTGKKMKSAKATVASAGKVALSSFEGLNYSGLAKLAKGKKEEARDENASDPFIELIQQGAAALAAELRK